MTLPRLTLLVLLVSLPLTAAHAACGAGSFGGSYSSANSAPVTTINPTGSTGVDVSLSSSSYNFTFLPGNPSLWSNLQPGGYVEYLVNAPAAGKYGLAAYYSSLADGTGADLLVNGVAQSALNLSNTGSWGTLHMSGQASVTLPSGQSVVRIAAQAQFQPYILAGLLFTPLSGSGSGGASGWTTNINPSSITNMDVTSASAWNGYTLYRGSPSQWGNLQPGGYVDYTINTATSGNYTIQLNYSTTLSGSATILVNGAPQQAVPLPSTDSWSSFSMSSAVPLNLGVGTSTLRIAAPTAFEPYNLAGVAISPASQGGSGGHPLAGQSFYVNPYSAAAQNSYQSCQAYYPDSSGLISKIAAQPQGVWFGDWNWNVQADVADVINRAAQQGAVPIMVAYDIPVRDCSGYSGGGAPSAAAYQSWIQGFASGIGSAKAVVILEPDALLQLARPGCLNGWQKRERLSLLNYAVSTLQQTAPNASVYIDAGRAGDWAVPAGEMAQRLSDAGVANAAGFALNVSNYIATDVTSAYGRDISSHLGNTHFVIDTSRNGLGAAGDLNWCNPPNRGLGAPSQGFSSGVVDGYVWVQNPGTSDGSCNGGPPAGQFSVPIACTLAHNAIF